MGSIGPMEWVIMIGLALLIFGGRRLGDIGKGLGEGIRGFKAAIKDEEKPADASKGAKT
ncbi:MAG: twin-arginine translocase TatA/TatE family subunit [Acidobacteria bacterium]|nr:twin-arginine translocase TatA/TatE family subunit [Acidobacteriota bacterium]